MIHTLAHWDYVWRWSLWLHHPALALVLCLIPVLVIVGVWLVKRDR